jgi:hypothetical protein
MRERRSSDIHPHLREDHLPLSDYPGIGVCWRERDPGVVVDTLIVHSCYVDDRVRSPARMPEISEYSADTARSLYQSWRRELEALKTAASTPDSLPALQARAVDSEFLALHAMLRSRLPQEELGQFSVRAIKGIFEFYGVSAHYLIDREGVIHELVPPERLAFHAGPSRMPRPEDGREKVNGFSIGIELLGTEVSGFTDAQYASLALLTKSLQGRFPLAHFFGHADIAPGRKSDPIGFDWKRYQSMIGFDSSKHFSV